MEERRKFGGKIGYGAIWLISVLIILIDPHNDSTQILIAAYALIYSAIKLYS